MKTLLNDLVEQYVAKNPKLMLRRTESVVEKLLTNWMSICLFNFLRESAGESFYMLFRAIKHQVDKGPVDAVTGKAKYTLNDNRLLREDVEYPSTQTMPAKVLDCDTITQVKEKLLDQTWKGTSVALRPHADSLHLGKSCVHRYTSRPVPLAVKYFFDLLDEQALQHNISDPETIHIWKTNSLPLRFWINILKNPQFIFNVQTSDHVDAVLFVIAQTFMDSCTIADHKLGRVSRA
uniref:Plexin cytoplasmic RasGAP domain-containing protein n=1 Tax=Hippocampus comes TaxID=109280 RepID=A0A3Q2Y3Z9_HIPCM